MAFNLEKNNAPSAESSRFDLAKAGEPAAKKTSWILVLLALILVGGGILYFTFSKKDADPKKNTEVSVAPLVTNPVDSVVALPEEKQPLSKPVAASFSKGTTSLSSVSAAVVKSIIQQSGVNTITIYGYASSEGDPAGNLKLSQERAESFREYLISKGVNEKIITAIGKGIEQPIASNDTEEGRGKNRRVEVVIQ